MVTGETQTKTVTGKTNAVRMAEEVSRVLHRLDLYPEVRSIGGASAATVTIDGRETANFASNSFLGLCDDPRVIETMVMTLRRSGSGAGSARLIISHGVHRELERRIAAFKHREDAVVFSTGMLVNLGVVPALASSPLSHLVAGLVGAEEASNILPATTTIFLDNWAHGCIQDGAALSEKNLWKGNRAKTILCGHMNLDRLERKLDSDDSDSKIIATDGVFSIHGHLAPLTEIVKLARHHGAIVYVDDAHGTGVLGPTGRGTAEELGCDGDIDIAVGTFSKAFGIAGGFVVGSKGLCDYIRVAARTAVLQTAMPPADAAGLITAINIAESEPWRRTTLLNNARVVRTELERLGFSTCDSHHHIVPVLIGDEMDAVKVHSDLIEAGIFAGCARYPATPRGGAIIRCNMMATHTLAHLEQLVCALERVGKNYGIIQ